MAERINEIWQSPLSLWENQHRLSLFEFLRIARTYLAHILLARNEVQHAYILFSKQGAISPGQCTEAISYVRAIDKPVEDISRFLDQKSWMPLVIYSLRYPLTEELACIKELLWVVRTLISRYRSICGSATREAVMQRYEINCKLESLLESCEDIVQLSQIMFDQARFQERRDNSAIASSLCPQDDYHSNSTQCSIHEFSFYHKKL